MNELLAESAISATLIEDLILVRYAIPKPEPKKVCDDVGKLLSNEPLNKSELDEIKSQLIATRFLAKGPHRTLVLTEEGRARVLRILQTTELSAPLNWSSVVSRYLLPQATGVSPEAKWTSSDHLAAFVLKHKYQLANCGCSTVNSVVEAIVCKELGYPEQTKLSEVLQVVLSKLIGSDDILRKEDLVKQVPLYQTGLRTTQIGDLRSKIVRDWLLSQDAAHLTEPEQFDLSTFASTLIAIAGSCNGEDRFHGNKVFLAPLWRASQQESSFPRLTLQEFKQHLVEANAQHLLHLSRADFVQAMDPKLVAESETTHLNASFHFLLLSKAEE